MTKRMRYIAIGAVVLAMALAVALWLVFTPGDTVEPLSAAETVERACETLGEIDHDSTLSWENHYETVVHTLAFSTSGNRVTTHYYTPDGSTLTFKIDSIFKDDVWYERASREGSPNTWGPWEVVDPYFPNFVSAMPCFTADQASPQQSARVSGNSGSSERHFVWKTTPMGDTERTDEFWVDAQGRPVRGRITFTDTSQQPQEADSEAGMGSESSSPAEPITFSEFDITFSGFGEPNIITAPIAPPKPGAPRDFTATAEDGQVTLVFYDPPSTKPAITGYEYRQRVGSGTWSNPSTMPSSFIVTGLNNGTQYGFQVRAVNSAGKGDWSAEATVTPASATPIFGEGS